MLNLEFKLIKTICIRLILINKLYHIQSPYVALILPFHTLRKINNNNAVDFMLGILLFTTGSVWEKAYKWKKKVCTNF